MVYMGSQKSSGDHFLGIVFNEELHGDLCFSPFCRSDTVIELQRQAPCRAWTEGTPDPLAISPILFVSAQDWKTQGGLTNKCAPLNLSTGIKNTILHTCGTCEYGARQLERI